MKKLPENLGDLGETGGVGLPAALFTDRFKSRSVAIF